MEPAGAALAVHSSTMHSQAQAHQQKHQKHQGRGTISSSPAVPPTRVPLQEEGAIGRFPRAAVAEEACHIGRAVVVAAVVRACVAPLRVSCLACCLGQRGQGAAVVALELADTWGQERWGGVM
jgi:hypothetical protein